MESSVAIALGQLNQMRKALTDDKQRKIKAARRSIECGQVRQVSKELKVAPTTIRRYRKRLLIESDFYDSNKNYRHLPDDAQKPTSEESQEVELEIEILKPKPAPKFKIELGSTGESLVCCNCKNSIDIKDLTTALDPPENLRRPT